MGFKQLINSKKTLSLLAAFVLFGTDRLMAQATAAAADTAAADKSAMWTGVGYYVLLFLVAAFCVAILGKILRVYDLTQQMQGKKGVNWNGVMGICCILFLIAGMYGAYWSLTVQGSMKLPEAASAHGGAIDDMFTTTTILTLIVFVITQICLFGFAFVYRGSDKRKAYFLPHNNTIEKVWTIVPAVVLTILVVFGFFTWQRVENSSEVKGDLNIDVTGHQFAWEFRYPGTDGKLGSLNFRLTTPLNKLGVDFKDRNSFDDISADTLVLPVHQSIRLNIHAQDVIHSVYMPHFRLQQNAVPGLPTFFKFIPTITTAEMRRKTDNPKFEYLLYCNKICGGAHYNMQRVVRVVSQAEYQDWISKQKPYLTDQLKKELHFADNKTAVPAASNRLALNN
ncbi:cytochrome c oxidase subunit II [Mucilaginibacter sp. BJC16-A38]|uniref:cytochrome c oxidase subunit II n=1 Tax=Mucilaginibacter phenanthrenivorans TaxID=1234842 RepID=UPI002158232F|nr:cytochrome c oxidase subunit II [Mucilaginibacter phenanthrenivorans]MCR8558719.1 cytochrome c oxidase subunit II [Mucilaginibacter phenanthrenivorans]